MMNIHLLNLHTAHQAYHMLFSEYFSLEKNIIGQGITKVVMPIQLFYLQLRTFYSFEDSKTAHYK